MAEEVQRGEMLRIEGEMRCGGYQILRDKIIRVFRELFLRNLIHKLPNVRLRNKKERRTSDHLEQSENTLEDDAYFKGGMDVFFCEPSIHSVDERALSSSFCRSSTSYNSGWRTQP